MGSGNSFSLWALGRRRAQGGVPGTQGPFYKLRLVGRKLLSNIIAAVIAFLAAIIVFLAAVIGFLAAVIGFLAAVIGRAVDRAVDLAPTLLSGA